MKTEQTEHITLEDATEMAQKTDYACFAIEEPGNEINWADAGSFYLEGFNAGYEKCQSNLKIKQLEWFRYNSYGREISETPIGNFYVDSPNVGKIRVDLVEAFCGYFDSVDEAKLAAQRIFERRVKECLE